MTELKNHILYRFDIVWLNNISAINITRVVL